VKMMFKKISQLINRNKEDAEVLPDERTIQCAAVALLIETMKADYLDDPLEEKVILDSVKELYSLSDEDASQLIEDAKQIANSAVSLQGFTRLLHEQLEVAEKERVISVMWKIALADNNLDRYEDYIISKISELLYVDRSRLMKLKHDAKSSLSST
jgi:uncharacterized tellurite resistance protein B-like protein